MNFVKRCPECGSVDLTYDSQKGEVICNECGLIVEEKIVDTGQEGGGQFDKSEKRGRGGAPISAHCGQGEALGGARHDPGRDRTAARS